MEDITITISKNRIFVPVVAVLLLWPAHGVAAEEAGTHERARGSFVKGLAAYQSRKWRVAEADRPTCPTIAVSVPYAARRR